MATADHSKKRSYLPTSPTGRVWLFCGIVAVLASFVMLTTVVAVTATAMAVFHHANATDMENVLREQERQSNSLERLVSAMTMLAISVEAASMFPSPHEEVKAKLISLGCDQSVTMDELPLYAASIIGDVADRNNIDSMVLAEDVRKSLPMSKALEANQECFIRALHAIGGAEPIEFSLAVHTKRRDYTTILTKTALDRQERCLVGTRFTGKCDDDNLFWLYAGNGSDSLVMRQNVQELEFLIHDLPVDEQHIFRQRLNHYLSAILTNAGRDPEIDEEIWWRTREEYLLSIEAIAEGTNLWSVSPM